MSNNETTLPSNDWLSIQITYELRVWHVLSIAGASAFAIVLLLCCCVKFRIPRTKQEIEADYVRRKLTRKFRKELFSMDDTEMDELDLMQGDSPALEKVKNVISSCKNDTTNGKYIEEGVNDETGTGGNASNKLTSLSHRYSRKATQNDVLSANGADECSEQRSPSKKTFGAKVYSIVGPLNLMKKVRKVNSQPPIKLIA